ncbi:uncharacterized protein LOC127847963 [Dreissena polymorpha]|nr:uncharacterized protein LOC127847963 [Dreissena polymorpha]
MDASTVLSATGTCIHILSAVAAFSCITMAISVAPDGTITPYNSSADQHEHSDASSGLGLNIGLGVGFGLLTIAIFVGAGSFYYRRKYVAQRNNEDFNPASIHLDEFYGSLNTTEFANSHTTLS